MHQQQNNNNFDPFSSIMSHFEAASGISMDPVTKGRQVNGHESVEPEPRPEPIREVDPENMSQGTLSWLCATQVWDELVRDGADPASLHELVIHAVNYLQHEARMMALSDFAGLLRKTGGGG